MGRKATSHELIKECIFTALMDLMKKKNTKRSPSRTLQNGQASPAWHIRS